MPIIIDKGWGLVRALRYSMLLTRDGLMPLLRMRWRMMHDEFWSTTINKATKRDLIRILMYRALEERQNDPSHNNMGDV
jgi:hypothetical protein